MSFKWRVFAWLFPREYDVLFDVVAEYRRVNEAEGVDAFDENVLEFLSSVTRLGRVMGVWAGGIFDDEDGFE